MDKNKSGNQKSFFASPGEQPPGGRMMGEILILMTNHFQQFFAGLKLKWIAVFNNFVSFSQINWLLLFTVQKICKDVMDIVGEKQEMCESGLVVPAKVLEIWE